MSKHWDISEICASRVTAAGEKQVLVVWRPTWEPVTETLMNGAVWDVWMQEQAVSKSKGAPVLAKAAAAADESDEISEENAGEGDIDESDAGEDNGGEVGEGDAGEGQKKAGWAKVNAFAAASTARHSKNNLSDDTWVACARAFATEMWRQVQNLTSSDDCPDDAVGRSVAGVIEEHADDGESVSSNEDVGLAPD
jgi:hypothetical protein